MTPTISICIPVYKSVIYLERLLNSIFKQTFVDFEIVITDDSPDDTIKVWLNEHFTDKRIFYVRNPVALGTPENWNEAIRRAKGEWIKIMHDDDWFSSPDALKIFYEAIQMGNAQFYFCAYRNIDVKNPNNYRDFWLNKSRWKQIVAFPPIICAQNVIGAPSVVMVSKHLHQTYDNQMKWLVDIDYYIRVIESAKTHYIPEILVNVGQSDLQVTSYTHNQPDVEIPEGLRLLSKLSSNPFHHILYYDVWWRLLRNLKIREEEQLIFYAGKEKVPFPILHMLHNLRKVPEWSLSIGVFSKFFMLLSYLNYSVLKPKTPL